MYNRTYNNGYYYNPNQTGDDRFGGGFVVPFVLGGLAGSLWNNNNNNQNYYYPYPYPYPYAYPYPYQYYNSTIYY